MARKKSKKVEIVKIDRETQKRIRRIGQKMHAERKARGWKPIEHNPRIRHLSRNPSSTTVALIAVGVAAVGVGAYLYLRKGAASKVPVTPPNPVVPGGGGTAPDNRTSAPFGTACAALATKIENLQGAALFGSGDCVLRSSTPADFAQQAACKDNAKQQLMAALVQWRNTCGAQYLLGVGGSLIPADINKR